MLAAEDGARKIGQNRYTEKTAKDGMATLVNIAIPRQASEEGVSKIGQKNRIDVSC